MNAITLTITIPIPPTMYHVGSKVLDISLGKLFLTS